jgi:hypothetical protein
MMFFLDRKPWCVGYGLRWRKDLIESNFVRSCFEIDEIIFYVLKILTPAYRPGRHLPFGIFP